MVVSKSTSKGIGFLGALQVAFIVLKLCKVLDWSWGWVLSPIWMPFAFAIIVLAIMFGWAIWSDRTEK